MTRRSVRSVRSIRRERLLPALEEARREATGVRACTPIRSDEYKAAGNLMASIDDLVELVTGDRTFLWHKQQPAGRDG